MVMAYPSNAGDVRAGAPARRADQQHSFGVGILAERSVDIVWLRWMGEMQIGVVVRMHPHGIDSGQDQPADHRLVRVSRDKQSLSWTCDREHRGLDRQ